MHMCEQKGREIFRHSHQTALIISQILLSDA